MNHDITITEEQRQGILKALGHLAVECPGWHPAFLKPIAQLMDEPECPIYEMYRTTWDRDKKDACLIESHKLLQNYADQLNRHDGGKRIIPEKLEDWIESVDKCIPVIFVESSTAEPDSMMLYGLVLVEGSFTTTSGYACTYEFDPREGNATIKIAYEVTPQHRKKITGLTLLACEAISSTYRQLHIAEWKYDHNSPPASFLYEDREFPFGGKAGEGDPWRKHPPLEYLTRASLAAAISEGRKAWRKYAEQKDYIEQHHQQTLQRADRRHVDGIESFQYCIAMLERKRKRIAEIWEAGPLVAAIAKSKGKLWEEVFRGLELAGLRTHD